MWQTNTIIPSVRNWNEFEIALKSSSEYIFLIKSSILTVNKYIELAKKNHKKIIVHIDMTDGLGKDRDGVEFIKLLGVDGIITTRSSIVKAAKSLDLFCIQIFFMVDSWSVKTTKETLKNIKPDVIQLLPGTMIDVISKLSKELDIPIITGGFIMSDDQINDIFASGAVAISTSKQELW